MQGEFKRDKGQNIVIAVEKYRTNKDEGLRTIAQILESRKTGQETKNKEGKRILRKNIKSRKSGFSPVNLREY